MAEPEIKITEKNIKEAGEAMPSVPQQKKTAVAVRYDIDRDKAPLVLATGRGPVADEILRIAEDNKIPLYEDPELAKLLAKLELDSEIPPELYTLVAEVLFFVYKLDRMAEKREKMVARLREEEKEKKHS